jgi:peptidoglycan hydrolase-like protein with peptidoglycan-binding domain
VLAGVLGVAAAAAAVWAVAGGDAEVGATPDAEVRFEDVAVRDMRDVETLAGTLGFEAGDPVAARTAGTLTAAPVPGTVLEEGDVVFRIDDEPVVLLYGTVPAYRPLALAPDLEELTLAATGTVTWILHDGASLGNGDVIAEVDGDPVVALIGDLPMYRPLQYGRTPDGPDVRQLEEALVALGFDPEDGVEVDETFDWSTRQMVLDWQEAIGAPEDGVVGVDEVAFLAEPVIVDTMRIGVGDRLQGTVPVAAVYAGSTPAEGTDVRQLEAALDRLGHGPFAVDGRFSAATEAAVAEWQEAVGAEADGVVDLGEVVFLPGPVRVADDPLPSGSEVRPGAAVFATTADRVTVSAALDAADQDLLAEGDTVTVVLPDETEAAGVVAAVASVARRDPQTGASTFDVTVELDDVSVAAGLDEAPVDVEVVAEERPGVMAVPVTALLALAEGGYAVEVDAGDGSTLLVAVEPGLYADGYVEIASDGLRPGDRVVVP